MYTKFHNIYIINNGAISETGSVYPSGAFKHSPRIWMGFVLHSRLVFCVVLCSSFIFIFPLLWLYFYESVISVFGIEMIYKTYLNWN